MKKFMHWNKFWRRCWYDKHGVLVIGQRPNPPLIVWIVCLVLGHVFTKGRLHTVVALIGTAAIAYWAVLELFMGDAYFRRLLGFVVLASVVVGIITS